MKYLLLLILLPLNAWAASINGTDKLTVESVFTPATYRINSVSLDQPLTLFAGDYISVKFEGLELPTNGLSTLQQACSTQQCSNFHVGTEIDRSKDTISYIIEETFSGTFSLFDAGLTSITGDVYVGVSGIYKSGADPKESGFDKYHLIELVDNFAIEASSNTFVTDVNASEITNLGYIYLSAVNDADIKNIGRSNFKISISGLKGNLTLNGERLSNGNNVSQLYLTGATKLQYEPELIQDEQVNAVITYQGKEVFNGVLFSVDVNELKLTSLKNYGSIGGNAYYTENHLYNRSQRDIDVNINGNTVTVYAISQYKFRSSDYDTSGSSLMSLSVECICTEREIELVSENVTPNGMVRNEMIKERY